MSKAKIALLPDRGVVCVDGEDAEKLLQGVITNDMKLLASQPALHTGLCTPQGKLVAECFVVKKPDGYCLETGRDQITSLIEGLSRYNLRSKVDISDASQDYSVAAAWGGPYEPHGRGKQPICFADPRLPEMGYRELMTIGSDWALAGEAADSAIEDDYHAHRISLGVPEGGRDYELGDTFPHEALLDQLNGVSFSKGCFVGQEVVARMQHRGTARKRVVPVNGDSDLPESGMRILAGDVEVGTLGSVAGANGLALLRLDRVAEFQEKGIPLMAGTVEVRVSIPKWATFSLEPKATGSPA
jgi:folate-binding protein YgfZ